MEKIINLLKNSEDDGTFLDSIYDLYFFIGIAKGMDDARNGREMTIEESRERVMEKYETYNKRYGSWIYEQIYNLENMPYIGRYVPKVSNQNVRELIYRKTRNSVYRIVYFISEITDTVHIIYVANCKQDFNRILKLHNYFSNFLKF